MVIRDFCIIFFSHEITPLSSNGHVLIATGCKTSKSPVDNLWFHNDCLLLWASLVNIAYCLVKQARIHYGAQSSSTAQYVWHNAKTDSNIFGSNTTRKQWVRVNLDNIVINFSASSQNSDKSL